MAVLSSSLKAHRVIRSKKDTSYHKRASEATDWAQILTTPQTFTTLPDPSNFFMPVCASVKWGC